MPAIPFVASLLDRVLVHRDIASPPNMTAAVSPASLEVVCAWPVSGQYGPGTRVLYYVLVVACVFARKVEWIRNACLAAVLLFPAIAALHGIVLAALHVDGAVDMDVYGAFQLCSIGILTAPATVRLSKTYFNNPGRDIIFLWTVLLLVGLISLIVEFMRLEPIPCPSGDPASIYWASTGGPNGGEFKFDSNCGLPCTENGPISPLRRGAADNIYVIPVPSELTFNAATLIAAACCIPAILSLVSMWIKILDEKFLKGKYKQKPDELIEGTNGATVSHMTGITKVIKKWLTIVGLPLFAAAVLAILVKGEMNFWSFQMMHQTEPIQSIGQWAPVVGTALAVLGSLYLIFSADMDAVEIDGQQEEGTVEKCPHCDCAVSNTGSSSRRGSRTSAERQDTNTETTPIRRPTTNTQPDLGRRRVARFLSRTSALLADKAHKQIEEGGFKRNAKTTYPLTPGEEYKNSKLQDQIDHYQRSSTPDNRSRAASFISNAGSVDNGEGSSRPRSPTRHSVPARAVSRPISRNAHSNSLPSGGVLRASTLQCPPATVFGGWQGQSGPFASTSISRSRAPSTSEISPTASSPGRQSPPRIFVSHDEGS